MPTNAYVYKVSTVKDGWSNGASLNGATMLWITGQSNKIIILCDLILII